MIAEYSSAIPKVIIGNPEVRELAYDFMPNYRPRLGPNVTMRNGSVQLGSSPVPLAPDDELILRLCDGDHTLRDILQSVARDKEVDVEEAGQTVVARLKWARSLNLITRDNRLTDEGMFVRIRKIIGEGSARHHWIYLPPFAQRVLFLSSGSFSCRQIAEQITEENGHGVPTEISTTIDVLENVIACCRILEGERIVAWIDDENTRESRLKDYLRSVTQEVNVHAH